MAVFTRALLPDVASLDDNKPPKSMVYLRKALSRSVNNVSNKLRLLEKSFYGNENKGRVLKEIKNNVTSLASTMRMLQISEIVSPTHVENVIKRLSERDAFSVTNFGLLKVKKSYTKVLDYVPKKFDNIKGEVEKIMEYLEKYCDPFYDPASQPFLNTCNDYYQSIRNWKVNVQHNLEVISKLPALFKDGALHLGMFGATSKDLAIKAEGENLLYLLIFPEVCECVRDAIDAMKQWLKSDELYETFLRNDMKDMEREKLRKIAIMRDLRTKCHKIQYQMHQVEIEIRVVEKELLNFQGKEVELLVEQELLTAEIGDMKLEESIKEFRLNELQRNVDVYHPDVLYETWTELTNDLAEMATLLPQKQKRSDAIQQKLDWSNAKKEHLESMEKRLLDLRCTVGDKEGHNQDLEEDYATVCQTLEMAKYIHLLKSCPDTVRKIYYNMLNKKRPDGGNADTHGDIADTDMDLACKVIAENIEGDWVPLYFCLPFYPTRGLNTSQSDIDDIKSQVRDSSIVQASRSLAKWRRFHTRAKLDDLKCALKKIRRHEVLALVENTLSPPNNNDNADQITYPSFMDEKLIPFYKEVEKFDQLRAMGKI